MRLFRAACVISVLVAVAIRSEAQGAPGAGYVELAALRARHSAMPAALVRRVTLRHTGIPLELALVEIARQAGLGLAYGKDLTIAQRLSTTVVDDVSAADAFEQLLNGTPWTVYVTSSGQAIVASRPVMPPVGTVMGHVTDAKTGRPLPYATVTLEGTGRSAVADRTGRYQFANVPIGAYVVSARMIGHRVDRKPLTIMADQSLDIDLSLEESPDQLEQVVVTGTIVPTEVKAIPTPITVISDSTIAQQQPHTVAELFREAVPTGLSWDAASGPYATAFTTRGASTLGPGGPMKIIIDGIDATDNGLSAVDPNSIDHIEVIRGPEAGAIYGSDAIGGVIQVFTKRGDASVTHPQVDAQASAADVQTPYAGFRDVLRQNYTTSVRGGSPDASYNVGGGYSHTGNYIPKGEESVQSTPSAYAGTHVQNGIVSADVSARYYVENAPPVFNPVLFNSGFPSFAVPEHSSNQYANQTLGALITVKPFSWWSNSLTLGIDRLTEDYVQNRPRLTTPADTELFLLNSVQSKTNVRYTTTVQGSLSRALKGSLTAGYEYWTEPISEYSTGGALNTQGLVQTDPSQPVSVTRTLTNNTGLFAQGQLAIYDALFLTAGLRAEWNTDFGDSIGVPISPRFGIAYDRSIGRTTVKLRGSWGSAIRAPNPGDKIGGVNGSGFVSLSNLHLSPERQKGGDVGIDAEFDGHASLSVTYFDQTAENLIQVVTVASDPTLETQNQNVGTVKNTGVELEGKAVLGPVHVTAQFGYARSRIDGLSAGYVGDYRIGDQALATPRRTAGALLDFSPRRGMLVTASLAYVGDYANYAYVAYFGCLGGTAPCRNATFAFDRTYRVAYPSFVKANVSVTQTLGSGLSVFITVDNIGNNDAYEQSDLSPVFGRITTAGLRLHL